MDPEVLVHIKSPASRADDEKYMALARNVLDFYPTSMVRVTEVHHDHCSVAPNSVHSVCFDKDDLASKDVYNAYEDSTLHCQVSVKRKRSDESLQTQDGSSLTRIRSTTTANCRRPACLPRKDSNPPYRNPMSGRAGHPQTPLQRATPTIRKVKSTPGSSEGMLESNIHQRISTAPDRQLHRCENKSDMLSESETIPDSCCSRIPPCLQQLSASSPNVDCPQTLIGRDDDLASFNTVNQRVILETNNQDGFCHVPDAPLIAVQFSGQESRTLRGVQGRGWPKQQNLPPNGENSSAAIVSRVGLLRPREPDPAIQVEHWTPRKSHGQTPDLEDAASISISLRDRDQKEVRQTDGSHHVSNFCGGSSAQDTQAPDRHRFLKIMDLPLIINGPDQPAGRAAAPLVNVHSLEVNADHLKLPNCFSPVETTRGVRCKERGYWKIAIDIAASGKAPLTQSTDVHENRGQHAWSSQTLLKLPSLTEQEFVAVWDDLNRYIASGSAGRGVRVIRRKMRILQNSDPLQDHLKLYLQVYCYGEAIPCTYAMLLCCTRLYVLYKPMEWISAVDGETVVKMAGTEIQEDNLTSWGHGLDKDGITTWDGQARTEEKTHS